MSTDQNVSSSPSEIKDIQIAVEEDEDEECSSKLSASSPVHSVHDGENYSIHTMPTIPKTVPTLREHVVLNINSNECQCTKVTDESRDETREQATMDLRDRITTVLTEKLDSDSCHQYSGSAGREINCNNMKSQRNSDSTIMVSQDNGDTDTDIRSPCAIDAAEVSVNDVIQEDTTVSNDGDREITGLDNNGYIKNTLDTEDLNVGANYNGDMNNSVDNDGENQSSGSSNINTDNTLENEEGQTFESNNIGSSKLTKSQTLQLYEQFEEPPDYRTFIEIFLNDAPPHYQDVTGIDVNLDEVSITPLSEA